MKQETKDKIEAIFPLSYLQNALLLHSLYEEKDQGVIHISCLLKGAIDVRHFENAWQQTARRHTALRSSIHWEGLEKAVQVIRPKANLSLHFEDWQHLSTDQQAAAFDTYREQEDQRKLTLTSAPIGHVALFQLTNSSYRLFWSSHHILLDGWSSQIILNDVFHFYEANSLQKTAQLPTLPTYRNYLNWVKKQDKEQGKAYWKERLSNMGTPQLFSNQRTIVEESGAYTTLSTTIDADTYQRTEQFIRQQRITINALMRGIWGLMLSTYFQTEDIVFGTTVSGRSADIPNFDKVAGLFSTVLPIRVNTKRALPLKEWLSEIQQQSLQDNAYEYIPLDDITQWSGLTQDQQLFNNLLILQNHSWDELGNEAITVAEYEGDLTTTYPITLIVLPKTSLQLHLRYKSQAISAELARWFMDGVATIVQQLSMRSPSTIEDLLTNLAPPPSIVAPEANWKKKNETYQPPQNKVELQLTKIWEELLKDSPIGTQDDFFQLGGTSLMAIRLFDRIESKLGKKLPPISLVKNRTIAKLAELITGDVVQDWSILIPLRASGSKTPVFCIHAGHGHVFFYQGIAKHLEDHPVYAIQPRGLNGESSFHDSIEDMAADYITEVKKIQPNGPYFFLGTCFGNAVCMEMASQITNTHKEKASMIIIDTAPSVSHTNPAARPSRFQKRLQWFIKTFIYFDLKPFFKALTLKFIPAKFGNDDFKEKKRVHFINSQLNPVYKRYVWPKHAGNLLFIRSRQFASSAKKGVHATVWEGLVEGAVTVRTLESRHMENFEEPAVISMSKHLKDFLAEELANDQPTTAAHGADIVYSE